MNVNTLTNAMIYESLCRVLALTPSLRCVFNREDIASDMIDMIKKDVIDLPTNACLYTHTIDEITLANLELFSDMCHSEQKSESEQLTPWKNIKYYLKKLLFERNASSRHV